MTRKRARRAAALAFDALTVEGALISPAMLTRIAVHQAPEQKDADYGIPKGLTLRDEIARYFRMGQAMFAPLSVTEKQSTAATVKFVDEFLRSVLGFSDLKRIGSRILGERKFGVTLEALGGRVPVVVVPPADDLDRPSEHLPTDGRRTSAASAIQDWLNATGEASWGLCSNGFRLRLVRDNTSLTRPAYIEADLRTIFQQEGFADFTALWLLVHASRFGAPGSPATDCPLERWREAGQKEGISARDRLRDGVQAALLILGNGFLAHPENGSIRNKLAKGDLVLADLFAELLRLIYRLIFVLVAEDRDLLHPPLASVAARKLYAQGYSLGVLRDSAIRRAAWDHHHDRWEGLKIAFAALARGEVRLGLPALGGLFDASAMPNIQAAKLANRALMEAIFRLAWLKDDSGLMPVNWRDMETEELGSVYESLLELTPQLTGDGRSFKFAEGQEAKGHARKTTGSYYTPDSLVQALLDSALDPVLDRVEAEADDQSAGLLSITVIDPACGSGHFLLAAARRIATRLARARTNDLASPADYRHALRDVVRACIHGVDRNPFAVELTKVALWIETVEPGKPLGFLDSNIRCGDALLGVFDLKVLEEGIPDTAYKPLAGDDKEAAKIAGRNNRTQREQKTQHELALAKGVAEFASAARSVAAMPEDDVIAVQARANAFAQLRQHADWESIKTACDVYVAAFLAPKRFRKGALERALTPDLVPTTRDVRSALSGDTNDQQLAAKAIRLSETAKAFHWVLEFPGVMIQRGTTRGAWVGFDVVLGNPPWERIKLQEQEFFAARDAEIATAPNAAAREKLIAKLNDAATGTRERALHEEFEAAKRAAEAASVFARVEAKHGGRFPLTGRGDVNTYALFAELFASLVSKRGRAGVIVPTGIATDATTASFFATLMEKRQLFSLHDFQTGMGYFDRIGHARFKFCLLTIGPSGLGPAEPTFSFFSRTAREFNDSRRRFVLSAPDIANINPNTRTAPIFRSSADSQLSAKVYARVPVLIDERKGKEGNPWRVSFMTMFHMSNDSGLFRTGLQLAGAPDSEHYVRLYEAKMIHHFDHRWATYDAGSSGDDDAREPTQVEKLSTNFEVSSRYWVPETHVADRLVSRAWTRGWLMGWRDITNATNERTVIASVFPIVGVGNNLPLMFFDPDAEPRKLAALLGCLSSLACDFFARHKVGGSHLNFFIYQQLAVLSPDAFTDLDLTFIVPRVLELTYTTKSMAPFARDLGYDGPPFAWDEDRRAQLRAELDAIYARAYGLTRDELRYILDPAEVEGSDYPSESFRVLKKNEIARFGEYRTARLILAAWDRMQRGEVSA